MADLKSVLKGVRAWEPLNVPTTGILRALLRIVGAPPRWIVSHLPRSGTVSCPLPGGRMLRLWSRGDDWVSTQLFWRGWSGYEPETADVFYRLASRAQVTLDVGAYVGFYSLLAAHANSQGRVFAFEPHPGVYPRLLRNVALNRVTNVHCLAGAVGEATGRAGFFHVGTSMPTSSSLSYGFMAPHGDVHRIEVATVALDDFLRERHEPNLDLVKIDTESTEPQVLRGMEQTLRHSQPAVICEVLEGQGTGAALEGILAPLGYRYYLLTSDGPRPREHIVPDALWRNHLFIPADPGELGQRLAAGPGLPR